jgi:hypothetical protein
LYLLLALVFTWPLVLGLTHDVPWDLGDSLLNLWILGWSADHIVRFLGGELDAFRGFWTANIFYPAPLTLGYSEHLFAQALQMFPIYALTHNLILCYNLLFLSTFVLSGLGTFLFVREVTGSPRAAFVAGLVYAFAPLRVPQFSHLQVISSQWMPFVLYGLRRYFDTRRLRPLVGATAALVAQNLSCGYFLLFFAPVVMAYALFEMLSRGVWRDVRVWGSLAASAAVSVLVTLPFLLPYVELRQMGFKPRAIEEVAAYSADVYGYLTAAAESRLWGGLVRAFPKSEAELFPSFAALLLATAGIVPGARAAWVASRDVPAPTGILRKVTYGLVAVFGLYCVLAVLILAGYGFNSIGPIPISVRNLVRTAWLAATLGLFLLAFAPRARAFASTSVRSLWGFGLVAAFAAFVLSLGPVIRTQGEFLTDRGPYVFLYSYVPGFDGLRVPARYGMLVMLFLAILAGLGAAAIERRWRRGGIAALVLGLCVLVEASAAPILVNGMGPEADYVTPPAQLSHVPPVFPFIKTLPRDSVIAEFPFGQWTFELRYMYYSTHHWRPLINGYSGTFPLGYKLMTEALRRPHQNPERAWEALANSGATHVVLHQGAYKESAEAAAVVDWLEERGARRVANFDTDHVFALPRPPAYAN